MNDTQVNADRTAPGCPADRATIIDLYFMEHRSKVIDIAAFLDRVERAGGEAMPDDNRIDAMRQAIEILLEESGPHRARRIQELLSDLSEEPIDRAPTQGAIGVPPNRTYDPAAMPPDD